MFDSKVLTVRQGEVWVLRSNRSLILIHDILCQQMHERNSFSGDCMRSTNLPSKIILLHRTSVGGSIAHAECAVCVHCKSVLSNSINLFLVSAFYCYLLCAPHALFIRYHRCIHSLTHSPPSMLPACNNILNGNLYSFFFTFWQQTKRPTTFNVRQCCVGLCSEVFFLHNPIKKKELNKRHRIFKFTWLHAHRAHSSKSATAYCGHRWFINVFFVCECECARSRALCVFILLFFIGFFSLCACICVACCRCCCRYSFELMHVLFYVDRSNDAQPEEYALHGGRCTSCLPRNIQSRLVLIQGSRTKIFFWYSKHVCALPMHRW